MRLCTALNEGMNGWMDEWMDFKAGLRIAGLRIAYKKYVPGRMDGWKDGWKNGCKSRVKDCLQQSKIIYKMV